MKMCSFDQHEWPTGEKHKSFWLGTSAGSVMIAVCAIIALALLVYAGAITQSTFTDLVKSVIAR
jgi:hypothetical protein